MMQVDLQCSFAIGSAMALIARKRLRSAEPAWIASARGAVLVTATMVFAPLWLYIMWRFTAWETMYTWDHHDIPTWLVAGFLPLIPLAASVGFWLTARALARGSQLGAALALGLPLASTVGIALWGWQRVTYVGTVTTYRAGGRHNLMGSEFMWTILVFSVVLIAPCTVLIVRWLRESPATS